MKKRAHVANEQIERRVKGGSRHDKVAERAYEIFRRSALLLGLALTGAPVAP